MGTNPPGTRIVGKGVLYGVDFSTEDSTTVEMVVSKEGDILYANVVPVPYPDL